MLERQIFTFRVKLIQIILVMIGELLERILYETKEDEGDLVSDILRKNENEISKQHHLDDMQIFEINFI
jgi:uncharacterized protein (UPF0248 family)